MPATAHLHAGKPSAIVGGHPSSRRRPHTQSSGTTRPVGGDHAPIRRKRLAWSSVSRSSWAEGPLAVSEDPTPSRGRPHSQSPESPLAVVGDYTPSRRGPHSQSLEGSAPNDGDPSRDRRRPHSHSAATRHALTGGHARTHRRPATHSPDIGHALAGDHASGRRGPGIHSSETHTQSPGTTHALIGYSAPNARYHSPSCWRVHAVISDIGRGSLGQRSTILAVGVEVGLTRCRR